MVKRQSFVEPTESAATRGERLLEALQLSGFYSNSPPYPSGPDSAGPSILSSTELDQLKETVTSVQPSTLKEAALTALLSPKIAAALKETNSGLVLSNSESIQWLPANPNEALKNKRKPDLFTAHPLRINRAASFEGADIVAFRARMNISDLIFGGLDMKHDSEHYITSLWKGKVSLGNLHVALGEMVDYVRCWGVKRRNLSIILYDMNGFVAGDCMAGVIRTLYKLVPWDAPESKTILKFYMTKHITRQIRQVQNALTHLQLRDGSSPEGGGSAYLGSGSYGDVFCVKNVNDEVVALKVARSDKSTFCREYGTLLAAKANDAPVVQVLFKAERPLSAYTMSPVGKALLKTNDTCCRLFRALKALHDSGWFHGDARYPNAIETTEGEILWVDLLDAAPHNGQTEALVQNKITLALSFVGPLDDGPRWAFIADMYAAHENDDSSYSVSFEIVSKLCKERGLL